MYRGTPIQALFWDDETPEGARERCGGGREVLEAPLCAACVVEVEDDGVGEEEVVRRALRRVDRVDFGVTRRRWEVREGGGGGSGRNARRLRRVRDI